jgi:predicted metal-dependent HD superfamily phosphohydrolase
MGLSFGATRDDREEGSMETHRVDEAGLHLAGEHIAWGAIQRVAIRTNSLGPWAEDVLWLFVAHDRVWEVPGGRVQGEWIPALHRHLPRVDDLAIIAAMGCTSEAVFLVFDQGAAPADPESLGRRFATLCARLRTSPGAEATAHRLLAAWQESHRDYHGLRHLAECLEAIDTLGGPAPQMAVVELAVWFHDAVFDPRARDNEERSAAWLQEFAQGAGIPVGTAGRAADLVRSTAHRTGVERLRGRDADVVHDADLAVLGAHELRFAEYEGGVRCEYGHVGSVPYALARGAFLRGLLEAGAIYRTAEFRASREEQARRNLDARLRTPPYRLHRWVHALRRLVGHA